jgi:adenylate cyclase
MIEEAVTFYAQAASTAHRLYAFDDAVHYLTKALDLLQAQPATPTRVEQEIDLLSALGAAWSVVKTWAAAEAQQAYDRAFALCRQFEQSPRLFTALWGLHEFHLVRSEYERALDSAEACLHIAQSLQEPALRLEAHHAMWGVLLFLNRYAPAIEHAEQGLALYDKEAHQLLAFQYGNHDAGHCGLSIAGLGLWMSGFADQARQTLQRAIELAQELSLPLSNAEACYNHAHIFQLLGDAPAVQRWGEAAVTLSLEHGLHYCGAIGSVLAGWAIAKLGDPRAGLDLLLQGMAVWEREGMRCLQTYLMMLQAETYLAAGEVDMALSCVMEGQSFAIEFNEHFFEPDLYRLQGDLLAQQGVPTAQVEACYQQAMLLARQHGAKMLELRAAIAAAKLWQQCGRRAQANDLLSALYAWFSEGFDTPELQEARLLLTTVAH